MSAVAGGSGNRVVGGDRALERYQASDLQRNVTVLPVDRSRHLNDAVVKRIGHRRHSGVRAIDGTVVNVEPHRSEMRHSGRTDSRLERGDVSEICARASVLRGSPSGTRCTGERSKRERERGWKNSFHDSNYDLAGFSNAVSSMSAGLAQGRRRICRALERKEFSAAFREFVRQNVASVEQVDVLLLLQSDPARCRTIPELSAALSSSHTSIARRLAILCARGLVKRDDSGQFQYVSDVAHDALVGELRREYALRPTSVIGLIYSKRTSALESFSDAFLLGGDDRDR